MLPFFKKVTGQRLFEYLQRYRLTQSLALLRQSSMSIAEMLRQLALETKAILQNALSEISGKRLCSSASRIIAPYHFEIKKAPWDFPKRLFPAAKLGSLHLFFLFYQFNRFFSAQMLDFDGDDA